MKKPSPKSNIYATIANAYYPAKYAIVHVLYFGFTLNPFTIVSRGAVSFNWLEIMNALLNFRHPFVYGFTFGSVWVFILMLIPYLLVLIWALRYVLIFLMALIPMIRFFIVLARSKHHAKNVTLDKQVQIHNGAPGTGKTRLLVILSDILAGLMFQKLSWLYWRDFHKAKHWQEENNVTKLEDWNEIRESYEYYTTPQKGVYPIPCLASNLGIEKLGQWSTKLKFEHLAQLERAPAYTIKLYSEFGTTANIEYSNDKLLPMSDYLRFCRQFYEQVLMGDEQDATNIAIDARRVVSDVWYMTECKTIVKPLMLTLPFGILKKFFANSQWFRWKWLTKFMSCWEKLIDQIGFVRFRYIREGNTEHQRTNGRGIFIALLTNPVKYDTRAFRKLADCRTHPLKAELHTQLEVENNAENRQAYLRAEYKNRPELFYTNTNDDEMVQLENNFWQNEALLDMLRKYRQKYPDKFARFCGKHKPIELSQPQQETA